MKTSQFNNLTLAQIYEYERITEEILEYSWRSVEFLEIHLFECGFRKKLIKMALKRYKETTQILRDENQQKPSNPTGRCEPTEAYRVRSRAESIAQTMREARFGSSDFADFSWIRTPLLRDEKKVPKKQN